MRKLIISFALLLLAMGGGQTVATAAEVSYPLDQMFHPIPIEVPTLALVSLTDLGDRVRIDVTNMVEGNLNSLYFNFNGDPYNRDPRHLTFSNVSLNGALLTSEDYRTNLAPTEESRRGTLMPPGDGFFDGRIVLNRTQANVGPGEMLSFDLGISGVNLSIADFQFPSLPSGGSMQGFVFASQIFGLEDGSVWVGGLTPVPLPASFLLFGSSLIGLFAIARMRMFAA
jgi:hypothetical protein